MLATTWRIRTLCMVLVMSGCAVANQTDLESASRSIDAERFVRGLVNLFRQNSVHDASEVQKQLQLEMTLGWASPTGEAFHVHRALVPLKEGYYRVNRIKEIAEAPLGVLSVSLDESRVCLRIDHFIALSGLEMRETRRPHVDMSGKGGVSIFYSAVRKATNSVDIALSLTIHTNNCVAGIVLFQRPSGA